MKIHFPPLSLRGHGDTLVASTSSYLRSSPCYVSLHLAAGSSVSKRRRQAGLGCSGMSGQEDTGVGAMEHEVLFDRLSAVYSAVLMR